MPFTVDIFKGQDDVKLLNQESSNFLVIKHSQHQCQYGATLTMYKNKIYSPEGLKWLNVSFRNIKM